MNSFGGSQEKYQAWGDRLKAHAKLDQLIKGVGWENGKGCFIGCSVHNYGHKRFAEEFGLPLVILELADSLECCDNSEAEKFALQVFDAIQVGVNYEKFIHYWCEWLILDPTYGVAKINPDTRIRAVGLLHREATTKEVPIEQWKVVAVASASLASASASAVSAVSAVSSTASSTVASVSAYASAAYAAAAAADASVEDGRTASASLASAAAASAAVAVDAAARASAAYVTAYARAAQRQQFLSLLKSDVFPND